MWCFTSFEHFVFSVLQTVVETDNCGGFLLFSSDLMVCIDRELLECPQWCEVRGRTAVRPRVSVRCVCLDSCPSPLTVYLSYTLFPFSCLPLSERHFFLPVSFSPFPPFILLFTGSSFFPVFLLLCFPFVFPSLPWLVSLSVLGHICLFCV